MTGKNGDGEIVENLEKLNLGNGDGSVAKMEVNGGDVHPPPAVPANDIDEQNAETGGKKTKRKRKRKKKKKSPTTTNDATANSMGDASAGASTGGNTTEKVDNSVSGDVSSMVGTAVKNLKREQLMDIFGVRRRSKGAVGDDKPHKFWDTQPVPKHSAIIETDGPIDAVKEVKDVRQEPYPLPKGFEWVVIDITDAAERREVYTLLSENYVEDDDNMFRFDYSEDFLQWALQPPGFVQDWHVGVRQTNNKKLRGFITGVPANVRVRENRIRCAEINFLCVHKKLRSKRLAPVLIKEVTRRINLKSIWQAVYTAGVVLPKPVGRCRYWHRSINPKKLIDVGFSSIRPRMNMARTIRLFKLPTRPKVNIRPMEKKDVSSACSLLNNYLKKFDLVIEFDEDEFAHWLLPRKGVIDTFVVTDASGNVTDMCSFYHLPSSIIGHDKYKTLYACYSFYNVATTMDLRSLMEDCLVLAKGEKCDVFNALDVMENREFLEPLKFGIGDGHLQYYLYNWRCKSLKSEEVGIVLL
eukprot:g2902.t1